ncbi:MAG: glycosyl transferase [Austwickia sp.]|nr:glycosyl transferase [Actinomycetota bacterium]MCO5310790.1 glycosyl transferase [Austwickia sp.]
MLRIVVSLGTDHHRFDRLVDWLDDWVGEHQADVTVTLQHGHSRPSKYADNLEIVARAQLLDAMRAADVVITQAGPGSMVDAHDSGHLPVVVPRSPVLREVVDDHQSVFADLMERLGDCVVARDSAALRELLDRAAGDAAFLLRTRRERPAAQTAAAVRTHMARAVERGPGWLAVRRLRAVAGPPPRTSGAGRAVSARNAPPSARDPHPISSPPTPTEPPCLP